MNNRIWTQKKISTPTISPTEQEYSSYQVIEISNLKR